MGKDKTIKIKFDIDDWLNANRRASRMIEIENGIKPKRTVFQLEKI